MIRPLFKSALITSAVYFPLYASLQVAPALTAPLALLMVGIAICLAIREILIERRLRGLVRHGHLPVRPVHRRRRPGSATKEKAEALALAA